jgi:hypothetical protein
VPRPSAGRQDGAARHPDHREVGGAAAEIGDHDLLLAIEPRRVARRRADRLVLEHHVVEPGLGQRVLHPRHRARVVVRRPGAPVAHRPADHRAAPEVDRRRRPDLPQVRRDHVVDLPASAEDRRPRERRARQVRLDRLDQPALPLGLQVARDRRRARRQPAAGLEVQHGAPVRRTGERHQLHLALRVGDRDRRVGRSKVDAHETRTAHDAVVGDPISLY